MSVQVGLDVLLAYTAWERGQWHAWFQQHGAAALATTVGPHTDGRFDSVGSLVRHIFSAETRYIDRLTGRPVTDAVGRRRSAFLPLVCAVATAFARSATPSLPPRWMSPANSTSAPSASSPPPARFSSTSWCMRSSTGPRWPRCSDCRGLRVDSTTCSSVPCWARARKAASGQILSNRRGRRDCLSERRIAMRETLGHRPELTVSADRPV